jgi:RNase P subunit RPR2
MDCYCDYGDAPEFYSVYIVKRARKQHKCDECHGVVMPGETYEATSGKWGGDVSTFVTCKHCRDLRVWVKNNVPCLCVMHGDMDEQMRDAIQSATWRAPEETKGLQFGFLRRMKIRDDFNRKRRAA